MNDASLNDKAFIFHKTDGADTLLVWFGGINEPFFSERFAESSGYDCLFLRDLGHNWYTNGLVGQHDTSDELVSFLNEARSEQHRRVIFCGQSSGGHAAIRYGLHCKANLCIAFSPQIRNFFDGQCRMVPHVKIPNLYEMYRDAEEKPRLVINVGRSEEQHADEFEWHDRKQVEGIVKLNGVTFIQHPYDNHAISVVMRQNGYLYDFVRSMIEIYGTPR